MSMRGWNGPRRWWASWRTLQRDLEPPAARLYLAGRCIEALSGGRLTLHAFHIVAQPVRSLPQLPARIGAEIEVVEISPGEPMPDDFPRDATTCTHHFDQGARCLVATRAGQFVGCHWFVQRAYVEDQFCTRFELQPQQASAWNFDLFVSAQHRLGAAFLRLWDATHAVLAAQGVSWVFSRIAMVNVSSLRAHARMGAQRRGWVVYLIGFRWQLMACSARPHVRLNRSDGAPPTICWRAPPAESDPG